MKKAGVLFVFIALGSVAVMVAAQNTDARVDPAKVKRGTTVYAREGCAKCHHLAGKGGNVKHPLDGVGTKFTGDQIRKILIDPETAFPDHAPAKGMPSYAKLSRADLNDLVAYVSSLKALDIPR